MKFKHQVRTICCFILFLVIANSATAQRKDFNNISYFSIYYSPYVGDFYYTGGYTFRTLYSGELGSFTGDSKIKQPSKLFSLNNINVGIGYQLTHWTSLRFDIYRYQIDLQEDAVTKASTKTRYTSYKSGVNWDLSINLIHDLTAKGTIDLGQKKYSPYIITGLGLINQKGDLQNLALVDSDSSGFPGAADDEKVAGWGVTVPIGVGFKYYIKHNVNVALEARGAYVLSDKIDHAGKIRGNGSYKDFLMYVGAKVTWQKSYKFNYQYYRKKHYHIDKSKKSKSKKEKGKSKGKDSSDE